MTHSLKAVYVLLGGFDFSWVICRSKHPKCSQEAIDDFKSGFSDAVGAIEKMTVSDGRLFNRHVS